MKASAVLEPSLHPDVIMRTTDHTVYPKGSPEGVFETIELNIHNGRLQGAEILLSDLISLANNNHSYSNLLYSAWKDLVVAMYYHNNYLGAYSQFQQLHEHALDSKDEFGLANAYTALATLTTTQHAAMISNYQSALNHLRLSDDRSNEPYIYFLMAFSEFNEGNFNESISYLDTVALLSKRPDMVTSYTYGLRLSSYVSNGDKENAHRLYNEIVAEWDSIIDYQRSNTAAALCYYLCKFGNPDDVRHYISHITDSIDSLRIMKHYYVAKNDFKNAYMANVALDSILRNKMYDGQREQLFSANNFYNNEQLKYANQRLETDARNTRLIILRIFMMSLILLFIASVYVIITSRRHTRNLMREKRKVEVERLKFVRINDMKTQFLHNMSSQMHTPINVILGYSDLLNNSGLSFSDEKRREMIRQIDIHSSQLMRLLNSVVVLCRIDNNDAIPKHEIVNIGDIVSNLVIELEGNLHDDVKIIFDEDKLRSLNVNSNTEFITIAIREVLDNAIKFTHVGSITIEGILLPGNCVSLTIADTGCGIPTIIADSIFNRFEKISSKEHGFGLGLSCAREVLRCINGSIWLDPFYRDGAKLIIQIPSL